MTDQRPDCPDCSNLDRRSFVRTVGAGAMAASSLGLIARGAYAAPSPKSAAETAAGQLYASLSDVQKEQVAFGWNDPRRSRINANWAITKKAIGSNFYTADQQKLIADVFKGVTSEEGHGRFLKQMDEDDGGFDFYSIAMFGEPGKDFEWVLTGRHLTLRADGNANAGMAFGGGLVYGHGEGNPKENLFHYQTKAANEVFKALDPKQREAALVGGRPPRENAVQLQGKTGTFPGLSAGDLSADQKELLEKTLKVVLAPYRKEDVDEALAIVKQGGGLEGLNMAFYQQGDLKNDKVWDIWRIEGPTFVAHFRGAPHVHAYIHVGNKKA